jgi:hypothetical protein
MIKMPDKKKKSIFDFLKEDIDIEKCPHCDGTGYI